MRRMTFRIYPSRRRTGGGGALPEKWSKPLWVENRGAGFYHRLTQRVVSEKWFIFNFAPFSNRKVKYPQLTPARIDPKVSSDVWMTDSLRLDELSVQRSEHYLR